MPKFLDKNIFRNKGATMIFGKLLTLVILGFSMISLGDKAGECTRLWQLEKELGCPAMPDGNHNSPTSGEKQVMSNDNDFGPTKCIPSSDSETAKRPLKKECDEWVKEQKKDLGANYLSGSCKGSCEPCPTTSALTRCSFKGEVKFVVR